MIISTAKINKKDSNETLKKISKLNQRVTNDIKPKKIIFELSKIV